MRLLYLLLLFPALCLSQDMMPGGDAFLGSAVPALVITPPVWVGYPTNQTGAYTWYVADGHWNATGFTWTNLCLNQTNLNSLDLTNVASGGCPTYSANALNGKAVLQFDGTDDYLTCYNYTSPQPHEVIMVLKKVAQDATANRYFFHSAGAGGATYYHLARVDITTLKASMAGTTTLTSADRFPTNYWLVIDMYFNGVVNSGWLTNNVAFVTGGVGTSGHSGMTVGARRTLTEQFGKFDLAEMITFRGAVLDATSRSNVFSYLTNKYAITY